MFTWLMAEYWVSVNFCLSKVLVQQGEKDQSKTKVPVPEFILKSYCCNDRTLANLRIFFKVYVSDLALIISTLKVTLSWKAIIATASLTEKFQCCENCYRMQSWFSNKTLLFIKCNLTMRNSSAWTKALIILSWQKIIKSYLTSFNYSSTFI